MTFRLSKTSNDRLAGVDDRIMQVIDLALTISLIDFGIPADGGLRTAKRQNELYQQGRTTGGNIITHADGYDKKSVHQSGKAFDVFAYVNGKASWRIDHLTQVANAILTAADELNVPLVWGGSWKGFKDLPHFEIRD